MRALSPVQMIAVGLALMLLGIALPLLMILRIIPSGFLLGFLAYAASFGGLILGMIGTVMYVRLKRPPTERF